LGVETSSRFLVDSAAEELQLLSQLRDLHVCSRQFPRGAFQVSRALWHCVANLSGDDDELVFGVHAAPFFVERHMPHTSQAEIGQNATHIMKS
jgi:hypothetical protein